METEAGGECICSLSHLKNPGLRLQQRRQGDGRESDASVSGIGLSWAEHGVKIQPCAT